MAEEKEAVVLRVQPDAWAAVEGHEKTRARLSRLLSEKRVPHALLFSGPHQSGSVTGSQLSHHSASVPPDIQPLRVCRQ